MTADKTLFSGGGGRGVPPPARKLNLIYSSPIPQSFGFIAYKLIQLYCFPKTDGLKQKNEKGGVRQSWDPTLLKGGGAALRFGLYILNYYLLKALHSSIK